MFSRFHRLRRGDDGVALVMAMAIVGIAGVLVVTLVSIALSQNRDSSNSRGRSASIMTAEGAVDATLAAVQNADVSALPCSSTTTSKQAAPDTITITSKVSYLDATGAVIAGYDPITKTELACPPSETQVSTQVLVKSVATTNPQGGGLPVKREFESLASLKPTYSTDLNKAIFGNAGITVGNNFDLYGQNGPDADIYTNGDFSCTNNEHFRGSVVAPQGSITLSNTCTIDVNAYARNGFTMSKGTVQGDIKVSNGSVNITGGTLVGKAYATSTSAWCTANPTKCTVQTPVRIPGVQSFPILKGDAATIAQYTAQGYTLVTRNNCDPTNAASPGKWLEDSAPLATTPVVLQTTCRLEFASNAKTVKLKNNVAVFAEQGIEVTNSIGLESTVAGQKHEILFIHPYDYQSRVTGVACNNNTLGFSNQTKNTGIALSNLVTMSPDIHEFLYTPCDVLKANQSTIYGQVYSGGVANIANKTDAYYAPVSVIGVSSTKVVEYYSADIAYKRESTG